VNRRSAWAGALALVALALVLRGIHLHWGLPEVFEEATPAREAIEMWGTPGTGLDLNPHFFKYPTLSFYLNFLAQSVWYFGLSLVGSVSSLNDFRQLLVQHPEEAVILGRWIDAVLGALLVLPAWRLGRRLAGPAAGWIAGALAAFLPAAVLESQLVGPDVLLALLTGGALVAATRIADRGERSDYLWCGLAVGLAAAAKYPGALLLVPLVAAHVVRALKSGRGPADILFSTFLLEAVVVAALAFTAGSPYVVLDAHAAARDIAFERRHMVGGHFGREQGRALGFYLFHAIPAGWTPLVALAALVGGVLLVIRRETRPRAIPGAAFALVVLGILGSWTMAAPRYALPLAPLAAAWAGAAAVAVPLPSRTPRSLRPVLGLLLGALLAAWPAARSVREVAFRGREDTRRAAEAWIERNVPAKSALLVERYGPEPDPAKYLVLYLPFHGVTPHLYDAAYSPILYSTFDYVILSAGVDARYQAKPAEYPWQTAFYAALPRAFEEVASFSPGPYEGPEIRILRRRASVTPPDLSALSPSFFTPLKGNGPLAEYYSALGTVLVRQGKTKLGFRMLQEAVDLDPAGAKVWGNLGVMRMESGDLEGALLALRRAKENAPKDPDVLMNMGVLYVKMGEARQAAEAYGEALSIRPELEEAYIGLARALIQDDHYRAAREVLGNFLLRFPRSTRRGAAEQALRELKDMGPGRP
jgi:tetratricopeptide (TPR) repeat protein/4-amino-4-deoxy-L-arabinose transferase-like glycosyltransferase